MAASAIVHCPECRRIVKLAHILDESDPNHGVMVLDLFYGECTQCKLEFSLAAKREEKR
jgi:hypothetical protein